MGKRTNPDPLSVVASVTDVAQAATKLSLALYAVSNRILNGPKELTELASELSEVSVAIRDLDFLLDRNKKVVRAGLIEITKEILEKFDALQKEIRGIIEEVHESGDSKRLKRIFKHPRVREVYLELGCLKTLLRLAITTLQVAIEQRKIEQCAISS